MTYIRAVPEESAEGDTAEMYNRTKAAYGYIPNFVKAFSHRPGVMNGFEGLITSIKSNMDPRQYLLVTIAAAQKLKSSYCMLAHGSVLMQDHYDVKQLQTIVDSPDKSVLSDVDKAIMAFAGKIVVDATSITADDVNKLRKHGLTEAEIFDIASAAAARCFISKTADAMGAQPDSTYNNLEPDLQQTLVVGRPIED